MKLLLVEDNALNRNMLSRRLVRRGYEVVLAQDGEEAIRQVQDESPNLVLMDLSLPILDGWSATRRIRSMPDKFDLPIIALTAHVLSGEFERALSAGCDDYDTKPIDFDRLIQKVEHFLGQLEEIPAASSPDPIRKFSYCRD